MFQSIRRSSRSSFPQADLRAPLLAGAAALVGSWFFLSYAPMFHDWLGGDVLFYENWGHWIAFHRVPYRDFALEYPPGALPLFAAPPYLRSVVGAHGFYPTWFRVLLLVFALLALVLAAWVLGRVGASRRRAYAALLLVGLTPALLGPIALSRYDYWPALFAAAAVAALVAGRGTLACGLLAAGVLTKGYPAVLLPIALLELWRSGGGRAVARGLSAFLVVLAAGTGPFLVLAPHGLWWAFQQQLSRPLQVESLGAALLGAAHELGGLHLHVVNSHGSDNVAGFGAVTTAAGVAGALALLAVYVLYARGPSSAQGLRAACAAAVTAYVAFTKVFSPQYLVWLVPLVPLVGGRAGLRASVLLVAVLGLTQIWSPYRYFEYQSTLAAWLVWLVVARDLLAVALFGVLVGSLSSSERDAEELDAARAALV
jgi:hypothetical protein